MAHQAKLGEAMQGLVIPRSRILDPESGGSCVRDPRSGIQKGVLELHAGRMGGGDLEDTGPQSTVARGETGSRI
mgnify:CR=1 FL=1